MEERETKKKRANEIRGRREEKKRGKYAIERIKKAEIENYKYRANQREGSETEGENIGCEVSFVQAFWTLPSSLSHQHGK